MDRDSTSPQRDDRRQRNNVRELKAISGHKSLSMLKHYTCIEAE